VDGPVYVILPVHNRRAVTERFVDCLLAQTDRHWILVVIDDGSTDGTAAMVRDRVPDAVIVRGSGDWWWGGALQQGYLWLRELPPEPDAVVLLINDDTTFDAGFIEAGREALVDHPRSLVLARLLDQQTGDLVSVGAHVDWRTFKFSGVTDMADANCFSTRGLFLRANDFLEIGGFHPRLLPHYLSDYEFTIRARRRGFALASDPRVRLAFDPSTTGAIIPPRRSRRDFLRTSLSRKSPINPVYLSTFILLACPPRLMPRNLFRVWRNFIARLAAGGGRAMPGSTAAQEENDRP
jgi:GT2 family glycosyltransferase